MPVLQMAGFLVPQIAVILGVPIVEMILYPVLILMA
jgi:hypothetical protein